MSAKQLGGGVKALADASAKDFKKRAKPRPDPPPKL